MKAPPDAADPVPEMIEQPDRFGAIFDEHFPEIHRYIAKRLDDDAADDLAAETFTIAFRRRGSYDPALGEVRPWLYGIATNLIAKHRRAEARKYRALERLGAEPVSADQEDLIAGRVSAQAMRARLAGALAALPDGQRDVLLLVVLGELKYEGTAEMAARCRLICWSSPWGRL